MARFVLHNGAAAVAIIGFCWLVIHVANLIAGAGA